MAHSSSPSPEQDPWASRTNPVPEDMRLQRILWRVQAWGWALLAALLLAALAGVFSQGPLSSTAKSGAEGGLAVEYQRMLRNQASDAIVIRAHAAPDEPFLRVGFSHSFFEAFALESISPPPPQTTTHASGVEFIYPMPEAFPAALHLSIRPHRTGLVRNIITLNGRQTVQLTQFVYP